jgi:hypothetical protein
MGLSSPPGASFSSINPSSVSTAHSKELAQDVRDAALGMKSVMEGLKDLGQELKNQQSQKVSPREKDSQLQQPQDQALNESKEQSQALQQQVQSQQSSQNAQLDGKDAEVVAAAFAALMEEDELDGAEEKRLAFEEKMELLMEKAKGLEDVELSNSDQNYELQKMMENLKKYTKLKQKEKQLDKQLDDLEIDLKQQETRAALNKLPIDDSTKRMRDQLLVTFDQKKKRSSEDSQDESHKKKKKMNPKDDDEASDDD